VLLASGGPVPGVLEIGGLRLTAFAPGTGSGQGSQVMSTR
jgi:hypothetical protein